MAALGSRNSHRMYNISDPIFGSYEYDSKVSGEKEQWKSGVRQPPGRTFKDDMTLTTNTVIEAK